MRGTREGDRIHEFSAVERRQRSVKKFKIIICAIGLIGTLGIVLFFLGHRGWTVLCAIFVLAESIINVASGAQNSFITEIVSAGVGALIAIFLGENFLQFAAVALCIEHTIAALMGYLIFRK